MPVFMQNLKIHEYFHEDDFGNWERKIKIAQKSFYFSIDMLEQLLIFEMTLGSAINSLLRLS